MRPSALDERGRRRLAPSDGLRDTNALGRTFDARGSQSTARPLISFPEGARLIGVSVTTLYRWERESSLPDAVHVSLGGRRYLRRNAFVAWIETGELPGGETPRQLRAVG